MKVCGPSFFSLRTIVWMFEKYYLNNKEKCDVYYDDRPVWIQCIDDSKYVAKVGFVDNFEEKDVYIKDLYE